MSLPVPRNELDQAIIALRRSRAAFPDMCRCLIQAELFFIMHYQPDLENTTLELKKGSPFPFALFNDSHGETVPAWTSMARADEGLTKCKIPANRFVIASMPANRALEIIGSVGYPLTLNKACATGELLLPANLLRDLADGTALKPVSPSGEPEEFTMTIMDPADFPTDVVQSAFEVFRLHPTFKAAWIFTRKEKPADYYLIVVMQPRDEVLLHDLKLVTAAAAGKGHTLYAQMADENDAGQIAVLFNCGRPFYQAVDYPTPLAPPPQPPPKA